MFSSRLNREPERNVSRPRLVSVQPPFHRCWSWYCRGYPCPGLVSTLLNHAYSTPPRLVQACLQVTLQVWQPMHLSRFITMASCAISLIGSLRMRRSASSVGHLLAAPTDGGDLITLVTGGAVVVQRERLLGVAADQVCRLDHQPGQRVVNATALTGLLDAGHAHGATLGVVHEHGALGHPVTENHPGDHDAVAVDRLDPLVVHHTDLGGVYIGHPDRLPAAGQREHVQVVLVGGVDGPLRMRGEIP